MRDCVENFVLQGGNAAFFSGNVAFWQARVESDKVICHKMHPEQDPLYGTPLTATMWSDPVVGRPENQMTGVSFTRGGYAHMPHSPRGSGGYTVQAASHWVFAGTELEAGDQLGSESIVVGYECDGCAFVETGAGIEATGLDDTPESFEVLAHAPARLWETKHLPAALRDDYVGELNWVAERLKGGDTPQNRAEFDQGHAVMGIFEMGRGHVFTVGCTDWAYGLQDPVIARVTQNVIEGFTKANSPEPTPD